MVFLSSLQVLSQGRCQERVRLGLQVWGPVVASPWEGVEGAFQVLEALEETASLDLSDLVHPHHTFQVITVICTMAVSTSYVRTFMLTSVSSPQVGLEDYYANNSHN